MVTSTTLQIKRMSYSALFIALSVILTRFLSFEVGFFRVGFGSLPIIISSIVCGPIYGAITGIGADVIGAIFFPKGPYFYGYTIDAMTQGILPFLVLKAFKGRYKASFIYSSLVALGILTYVIFFVLNVEVYSNKSLGIKFEITNVLKFVIPSLVVLYFIIFLLVSYFFHRQKKIHIFSREERYFSFFDIYLISMTNTLFISMTLLSVWNNMMFNIPYLVNSFTQLLTFSVNGILR
ncbi:MAG: folate family ECF transporter S component, partial [Bacilli bacterium]|nr:folate family ECF transporter S component [Bacilli bacterium]